jgi:hypothetical protein
VPPPQRAHAIDRFAHGRDLSLDAHLAETRAKVEALDERLATVSE